MVEERNTKRKFIVYMILALLVGVGIGYAIFDYANFHDTGPNSDAEGFLISMETSGGTSAYFSIYYVETNETGYSIQFYKSEPSNLTGEEWEPTNVTESITIGRKTYWYNSTFENNIPKFQEIIEKTGHHQNEVVWNHPTDYGNSAIITEFKQYHFEWYEEGNITNAIGISDFESIKWNTGPSLKPGGGPSTITIPQYQKRVIFGAASQDPGIYILTRAIYSVFDE